MDQSPTNMTDEEANEYLIKLQSGRTKLDPKASFLEGQVYANLMNAGQKVRQLVSRRTDCEKQIEALKAQEAQVNRDIEAISGEQSGYAKLLLAAENERRAALAGTKVVDVPSTAEKQDETKGAAEKTAAKKKPGPPKGKQPEHLNKQKPAIKTNGASAPAEAAPEVKAAQAN